MIPTELQEHRNLVAYLRIKQFKFTHVANETGSQGKWQGIQNKRNGVSPGFPDFLIIVNNRLIAVELKRIKGSNISPEQREWIESLNACAVPSAICKGYDEAVQFIESLLT